MTKYCDLIKQRSLGAIVAGLGIYGLEKMLVGDSYQGSIAKYANLLGKMSILAGIAGYAYSYFVSGNTEDRRSTDLNTTEQNNT